MEQDTQIILGIDPGTLVMGYGLIAITGSKITMIEMGVLELHRRQEHAERLELIFRKMETLIKTHNPSAVAIEAPFFGKNVQSMLKLGRAQGVAIAAAMMHGLNAVEYSPRKIKQSVSGRGNATKEQVWEMLQQTLKFREDLRFLDAADALAVALCHHYQLRIPEAVKSKSVLPAALKAATKKTSASWLDFAATNPGRVKGK